MLQATAALFVVISFTSLATLLPKGDELPDNGAQLYTRYKCKSCHGKSGEGPMGDLRKASSKYTQAQLRAYILRPADFNNKKMPAFENVIPDKDLDQLIQFLDELAVKE